MPETPLPPDDEAISHRTRPGARPRRPVPSWRPVPGGTSRLRRRLFAGDIAAVALAWAPQAFLHGQGGTSSRVASAVAAPAATLLVMQRARLYRSRVCAVRSLEAVRVMAACLLGATVFAGIQAMTRTGMGSFDLGTVARPSASAAGAAIAILTIRWHFGRWLKAKRFTGHFVRTVVMVGADDDAVGVWDLVTAEPELGYRIAAVVGPSRPDAPWANLPTCSDITGLAALAHRSGAAAVVIVGSALTAADTAVAVGAGLAAGLHVEVWPGLGSVSARRIRLAPVLGVPIIYVEPPGGGRWPRAVKRLMDLVLTVAVLPLAFPLLLVAAVLIKLEDGGPVLHHHQVIGRSGTPITVLKLRTMVPNAAQMLATVAALNERTGGPLFKAAYDPRVTRVGRILRATSIDELPQLWDVLRGAMSLVGPRFALPAEVEHFDAELRRRHEMRPGMTGLWQSEARDNPSFSAYRRLDLYYIDNWSVALDAAILLNTAYGVAAKVLGTVLATLRRHPSEPHAPAATQLVLLDHNEGA